VTQQETVGFAESDDRLSCSTRIALAACELGLALLILLKEVYRFLELYFYRLAGLSGRCLANSVTDDYDMTYNVFGGTLSLTQSVSHG